MSARDIEAQMAKRVAELFGPMGTTAHPDKPQPEQVLANFRRKGSANASDYFFAKDIQRAGSSSKYFPTSSAVSRRDLKATQQELRQAQSFFYPEEE